MQTRFVDKLAETIRILSMSAIGSKQKGFSGTTHFYVVVVAVNLVFMLPQLLPIKEIMTRNGVIYSFIFLCVCMGASLLNDLDNEQSTALFVLGPIGSILKTLFIVIASVIYNIYHLKGDRRKPGSYHRFFWHTPMACFLVSFLAFLFLESESESVFAMTKNIIQGHEYNIANTVAYYTYFILVISCFYLCVNMVTYKISKLVLKEIMMKLKTLLTTACFFFLLFKANQADIRYLSIAIGFGMLGHILGDLCTKGSVPLAWPVPIGGKAYWKPAIPGQIETAGIANKILDIILLGVIFIMLFINIQLGGK